MILDSFKLNGKNALVTGSQTGLGAGIAVALAQAGANVVIHGRNCCGMENVCAAISEAGRKAPHFCGDISNPKVCEDLVAFTVKELGSIDIMVNNAGIIRRAPAAEFSESDWYDVLEVNLSAVFRILSACRQSHARQRWRQNHQHRLTTGFQGGVLVPSYAAAKGAVAQLIRR